MSTWSQKHPFKKTVHRNKRVSTRIKYQSVVVMTQEDAIKSSDEGYTCICNLRVTHYLGKQSKITDFSLLG